MKKALAILIFAAVTSVGVFAQATPPYRGGKSSATVPGAKGKKSGPQDGSGPIHQPGTGGGTGKGQRGPRR